MCSKVVVYVVTAYWRSGFSAIRWSSALRAVTKGRVRAVVWEVVLGTTIGTWPTLCVSISSAGNGFMP